MGLRGVGREESDAFGITAPNEKFIPLVMPFNAGVQASIKGIPESGRENLRTAFGDAIRFDGDTITLQRNTNPETHEQRNQSITESLRDRARAIADAGREQFAKARSEDPATAWPPGFETGEYDDEVLAHTAAVAVGRKLLYHDEWADYAKNFAALIRHYLPPEVQVTVREGHVYAYRPGIINLEESEIHELIMAGDMGRLLGYGQNLLDEPGVLVHLADEDGKSVSGFRAPLASAMTYAKARAKDWSDALGWKMRIFIARKEMTP